MKSNFARAAVVCMLAALGLLAALIGPEFASAALPSVGVSVTTTPLTNTTAHTGVTVTASCAAGTLVGGGAYDDTSPPTRRLCRRTAWSWVACRRRRGPRRSTRRWPAAR